MPEDKDLELLRRKRLMKLQKRLLIEKEGTEKNSEKTEQTSNKKNTLRRIFVGRAWEVWKAAEQQYPELIQRLGTTISTMADNGKLKETINGEQLYGLFSRLGLHIRLKTKIRIFESGELKTIADKLKEK